MQKVTEFLRKNHAWVAWALMMIAWGVAYYQYANKQGQNPGMPPAPPPIPIVFEQQPELVAGGTVYATGWAHDPELVAANLDPAKTLHFDTTPAGRASMGDEDVYLWQHVRRVNNKGPPWYPTVDQKSVGCCVGCGWKHSTDVCEAVQISQGKAAEWKPVSVEAIYGLSRVDIGGGQMRGDGSNGSWAKAAVEKFGVVAMQKYAGADLTTFDPMRARQFGSSGLPADVKAAAMEHPIKGCALVKTWADAKKAIQQGYPVAVCSNQGFAMQRDATGRCRPQGTWAHCMAILAVRSGAQEGGFILNSWGDQAHTGPVWPPDAPAAGFWADAGVIDRMLRMGDSFALSGMVGFPARRLKWVVHAPLNPLANPFARRNPEPEVSLAW